MLAQRIRYLEQDPFVEAVIEMAMPIAHGEYDYPTLCEVAPHRAYVLEIDTAAATLRRGSIISVGATTLA